MEIVKVQILNDAGEPAGRAYSYFTAETLNLGDFVQVPVSNGGDFSTEHMVKAQVVAVNVAEDEIAAFRDRVKTIPSGSKRPPTQDKDFIPEPKVKPLFVTAETVSEAILQGPPQARLTLNEDAPEEAREAAAALEEITGGQIKVEPEFPTEEEVSFETLEAATADIPSALITIETQVGRPAPELLTLYLEAAGLLEFAKARVISTNADLKPATDDLAIILTCRKGMETRKGEIVRPLREKLDLVYQAFNDLMFPVLEAERLTKEKVKVFESDQARKAAEAARIEDEKFRLAQEEAALKGGEITVPLETVEAPPPVPERTRTGMGTLSGRDNWKARVIDFAKLPDEFKIPDMAALHAKARSTKGTAVIPGVEFFNDRTFQVRTKTERGNNDSTVDQS